MNKFFEILIGFISGVLVTFLGSAIFLYLVVKINPFTQFQMVIDNGSFGRVIVIGCILNLFLFRFFIKKKLDYMARGSILAVIVLTILTQLI